MGRFQGLHLHIVVHHAELVFQISPGEGAVLHLGDAPVFEVLAEKRPHHAPDPGLALAAAAFQE